MAKWGVKSAKKPVVKKKAKARTARSQATRILAQGAGAFPRKAFGAGKEAKTVKAAYTLGLNARLPHHLGLPRAVGPYQVIRTSKLLTSTADVIIFSPIMLDAENINGGARWYGACGIESVDKTNPVNATNNSVMIDMPMDALGGAVDVVPAAMTVQVMCPTALQTAAGLFTMARASQPLSLGGDSRTWSQFRTQFNSFFRPRVLTGGKLALRGVTCNAVPLDMSEYADFAPVTMHNGTLMTWDAKKRPAALSPIVFTSNGEGEVMSFLVTIEWRVRFDPQSPAAASHVFHEPTSDAVWGAIIKRASEMGHGVEDIVDGIADIGAAVV
jgi:hypothetical protein